VKYFIALAMFVYADDEGRPESPFVVCEREAMDHAPPIFDVGGIMLIAVS
jgi:hypothetical protein